MPPKKLPESKTGFLVSTKRFITLGVHPNLSTQTNNKVPPGQYNPKPPTCAYKHKCGSWKIQEESEEFSKFLGFKNPDILKYRNFRRTLGGPGNYDLFYYRPKFAKDPPPNLGFGKEVRFKTFFKFDQPPPGSHNVKRMKRPETKTPTFEFDGLRPRFQSCEPSYKKAPNRYIIPHKTILDKVVSKRGPYDCFTGPRDGTTIKNKFSPPMFRPPDQFFVIESPMDHLLHHRTKSRCGKFLQDARFPEGSTLKTTKNGFSMFEKNTNFPGPAHYDPYKTRKKVEDETEEEKVVKATRTAFNSSNPNARPPINWRIHPGPDRYKVKYPRCHKKSRPSWVFLTKATRDLITVESYSNFIF